MYLYIILWYLLQFGAIICGFLTAIYAALSKNDPTNNSIYKNLIIILPSIAALIQQIHLLSEGMLVNYYDSAATSSGGSVGTFLNNTYSDSVGNTNVEFWLQDTSYHGFVYINGYINTTTGRVMGSNKILIQ